MLEVGAVCEAKRWRPFQSIHYHWCGDKYWLSVRGGVELPIRETWPPSNNTSMWCSGVDRLNRSACWPSGLRRLPNSHGRKNRNPERTQRRNPINFAPSLQSAYWIQFNGTNLIFAGWQFVLALTNGQEPLVIATIRLERTQKNSLLFPRSFGSLTSPRAGTPAKKMQPRQLLLSWTPRSFFLLVFDLPNTKRHPHNANNSAFDRQMSGTQINREGRPGGNGQIAMKFEHFVPLNVSSIFNGWPTTSIADVVNSWNDITCNDFMTLTAKLNCCYK